MAKRNQSDATQHETFPGAGPRRMDHELSGLRPVEQMVDAAIDRLAREYEATLDATPQQTTSERAIIHRSSHAGTSGAIVREVDIQRPGRLRWKGLDVSDEFRRYAERVARGEDLPPYEGRILAEPSPKFPWEPEAIRSASRRATRNRVLLWSAAAVLGGLSMWTVFSNLTGTPSQAFQPATPPSVAILSNRSPTPAAPVVAAASSAIPTPGEQPLDVGAHATAAPERTLGSEVAPKIPGVELPAPPVRPRLQAAPIPQPAYEPAARITAPRPSTAPPAVESAPATPVDIASPGALKEALGALLAARNANETAVGANADSTTSGALSGAVPNPQPATGADAAKAGPAGKEPASESSSKGSLLVETPSF